MDSIRQTGNLNMQVQVLEEVLKLQEAETMQMVAMAVADRQMSLTQDAALSALGIGSKINTTA